jgi:hypothetical protein
MCLLSVLLAFRPAADTRPQDKTLPVIAGAAVPLYPPAAVVANTQGVIHVRVSTDGHEVVEARAEEKIEPLTSAAEQNAKTWRFATHQPRFLTITYKYRLSEQCDPNNETVTLRFPTEVEVCMRHTPIN